MTGAGEVGATAQSAIAAPNIVFHAAITGAMLSLVRAVRRACSRW